MLEVIRGHVSPETAYVVEDYPYGRQLRCKIRYWVETATKGAKKGQQRFMSQTTNPKAGGEVWNKPKGGTYSPLVVMVKDQRGHVYYRSLHWSPWPDHLAKLISEKVWAQLDEDERRRADALLGESRRLSPKAWAEWEALLGKIKGALGGADTPLDAAYAMVGDGMYRPQFDAAFRQAQAELFNVYEDAIVQGVGDH